MKTLVAFLVVVASAQSAAAQAADRYRGGWRTDDSDPHTYEFSIRGEQVRGIYCTLCSDATTLAFIDGKLDSEGMTFVVTHVQPDGRTAYQDRATARIEGDRLIVAGTSGAPRGGSFRRMLHRDSRGPDPLPGPVLWLPDATGKVATLAPLAPRGGGPARGAAAPPAGPPAGAGVAGAPGAAAAAPTAPGGRGAAAGPGGAGAATAGGAGRGWQQPGPWKNPLSADDVVGAWIGFGTGVNKQYFIFRRVGNRLRGMVCGRCDNPFTLAALDDIEIDGDTLRFKILHDGWGDAPVLPFDKWVTARIVANELRAVFETPKEAGGRGVTGVPPSGTGTTLIGPIPIEGTRGNDSRPAR
ncbi:MAG TPA: hypothetical protein VFV95_08365 [Vicinamibacterales bacterium]|nr:hypothetical protein [Vicinamibacterales bacterium]